MLAFFHRRLHDLLDEGDLTENLLHGERGGSFGFAEGDGAFVNLCMNDLSGIHDLQFLLFRLGLCQSGLRVAATTRGPFVLRSGG